MVLKKAAIPVEGDVQVFADPECTEYADGTKMPVYVRVNVPWVLDGDWQVGSSNTFFGAYSPTTQYPEDPFAIRLWEDFASGDKSEPYERGQVVEVTGDEGYLPVSNPTVIFSKP